MDRGQEEHFTVIGAESEWEALAEMEEKVLRPDPWALALAVVVIALGGALGLLVVSI